MLYSMAYALESAIFSRCMRGCRTNASPVVLGEAHYEQEAVGSNPGNTETGTPLVLRKQEWWTAIAGGKGQFYGNHYTWTFTSGWQNQLVTEATTELNYWRQFCASNSWLTWTAGHQSCRGHGRLWHCFGRRAGQRQRLRHHGMEHKRDDGGGLSTELGTRSR